MMQVHIAKSLLTFFSIFFSLVDNSFTIFPLLRDNKHSDVCYGLLLAPLILRMKTRPVIWREEGKKPGKELNGTFHF